MLDNLESVPQSLRDPYTIKWETVDTPPVEALSLCVSGRVGQPISKKGGFLVPSLLPQPRDCLRLQTRLNW